MRRAGQHLWRGPDWDRRSVRRHMCLITPNRLVPLGTHTGPSSTHAKTCVWWKLRAHHYPFNDFFVRLLPPSRGSDRPELHMGDTLPLRWNLKVRCDRSRYLSFISSSLNASVGVLHPRHFLGVPFKRPQIDFISRFKSVATGASLGDIAVRACSGSRQIPSATAPADHRTMPPFRSLA